MAQPTYYGRGPVHRFDAPDGSFGVCYLGTTLDCCFLEVLSSTWGTAAASPAITTAKLGLYYAATVTSRRPLRLAYLADDGLAHLQIDQRVTGGNDYALSGAWAEAIYHHAALVDGIFYASRHHNGLYSVALFDRASPAVSFHIWGTLGDPQVMSLWAETACVLDRFKVTLL